MFDFVGGLCDRPYVRVVEKWKLRTTCVGSHLSLRRPVMSEPGMATLNKGTRVMIWDMIPDHVQEGEVDEAIRERNCRDEGLVIAQCSKTSSHQSSARLLPFAAKLS